MDSSTLNLIERPFQEIVDDLLTAIVGGVVNEPIIFDIKQFDYQLAEPAQDIRGITGKREGLRHTFQKHIDFEFSEGENAVIWLDTGTFPDDETVFFVDYFRRESKSPLTDINVGSVTRTLGEAIGREIRTVYEQINLAYLAGFIDTAEGKALDLVVAILGVTRKTKAFATGLVSFFRDAESTGNITVPQGAVLATTTNDVRFETTEPRTLQRGQVRIDIPIRAAEDFKGDAGLVPAGAITVQSQPIEGITRITNFDPTIRQGEDESDVQLRLRAKAVLRALGKATIAAISRVITEVVRKDGTEEFLEIRDPNSAPIVKTRPGELVLILEAEPEQMRGVRGPIHETRAAGVLTTLIAKYVFFKPRIVVETSAALTGPGKDKLVQEIIAAFQAYIDGLSQGDAAVATDLLEADAVKDLVEVSDIQFVDVLTWKSDLAQPGTESLVDQLVNTALTSPAGNTEALRAAFKTLLEENPPPDATGRRIADRSLVVGETGERATDQEIEEATFSVQALVDGEEGWIVLDMEPADVVLTAAA